MNETTTALELKRTPPPVAWLIEYERKADARQASWEPSPFAESFRRMFP